MKSILTIAIAAALATLAVSAMACSSNKSPSATATRSEGGTPAPTTAGTPASQLSATLLDYSIQLPIAPSTTSDVTLNVKNDGSTTHELVVLKTDLAPADLPTKADGSANEDAEGVTNVGETGDMEAGASDSFTVDLQPGHYVVICNVVQTTNGETISHYQKKMYTEFTIAP
jgi:hypothetical protein